jgi:hypothetical protein
MNSGDALFLGGGGGKRNLKVRTPVTSDRPVHLFWPLNDRHARCVAFVNKTRGERITSGWESVRVGMPDRKHPLMFGYKEEGR